VKLKPAEPDVLPGPDVEVVGAPVPKPKPVEPDAAAGVGKLEAVWKKDREQRRREQTKF
jgi:hypothetical protein